MSLSMHTSLNFRASGALSATASPTATKADTTYKDKNEQEESPFEKPRKSVRLDVASDRYSTGLQNVQILARTSLKRTASGRIRFPSSLDFERVVNHYSIEASRESQIVEDDAPTDELVSWRLDGGDVEKPLLLFGKEGDVAYSTFDEERAAASSAHVEPPHFSERRKTLGFPDRSATRWVLTILTGLLTGVIAIVIVTCTDRIQKWRSNLLDTLWQESGEPLFIFCLYAATNLSLAMLSAVLCLFLAPEAIGSGIPEVKSYLNGVRVKRFTSMRLFLVKILGTILSVSSGLCVGPEGPLVHIGAILGASCTKISNTILGIFPSNSLFHLHEGLWSFVTTDLAQFAVDSERRDLVSIGAAAGFAAAFGAPIGGLLFSMEEASSYFDNTMFLKTLSATAIATFCLAVHHGDLSDYSIISLGHFHSPDQNIFLNRVEELPLYVLVAVGGGILGGLFCRLWELLQLFRKSMCVSFVSHKTWRLSEVAIVSLLTSSLTYFLPLLPWACRSNVGYNNLVETGAIDPFKFHAHKFNCPGDQVNELADFFFGSREEAIKSILTDPSQFTLLSLLTVGAVFFPLMILTLGSAIPSGIFMPTVLIGSSLGAVAGLLFQGWLGPELDPATFALLGAAALLAGIQRSTVSLSVILVEGTGSVSVLIPVILTVVVARYVAELVHKDGIYETAIELNNYPYLDHQEIPGYDIFEVREIMSSPPVTIGPRERADIIVQLLKDTNHHGFPIVDPNTKKFLGLVRRDQLVALLECGVFEDAEDEGGSGVISEGDDDSSQDAESVAATSEQFTHQLGNWRSQLMNRAYHISDDRFDHIPIPLSERNVKRSPRRSISNDALAADTSDKHAWLVALRQGLASMPSARKMKSSRTSTGRRTSLIVADKSLPPLRRSVRYDGQRSDDEDEEEPTNGGANRGSNSTEESDDFFAIVGTNVKGSVYVQWLNPQYKRKVVNVAGVMNKGTYTVTEFCPVSKARYLFTALGLRHLIVLGGESGGEVVGLVTRINVLKEYIEERTGYEIKHG